MSVTLGLAFKAHKNSELWREVARHTEELLKDFNLVEYDVLISPLPLGTDDLQKVRLRRIDSRLDDTTGQKRHGGDIFDARLEGRRFEILFDPDYPIKDPKEFAELNIVDTLDDLVNGAPDLDEL